MAAPSVMQRQRDAFYGLFPDPNQPGPVVASVVAFSQDIQFLPDTGVHLQHSLTPGAPGMAFVGDSDCQVLEVWSNPPAATSTVDPFVVYGKYLGTQGVLFDVSAPGFCETGGVSFASGIRGSNFPNGGGNGSITEQPNGSMAFVSGALSDGNFSFDTVAVGTLGKHPGTFWRDQGSNAIYFQIVPGANIVSLQAIGDTQLFLAANNGTSNAFAQFASATAIYIDAPVVHGRGSSVDKVTWGSAGLSFFAGTLRAQTTVAGNVTAITDANAKAVIQSLLAALDQRGAGYNLINNTTT